jgi:hypothetical protein
VHALRLYGVFATGVIFGNEKVTEVRRVMIAHTTLILGGGVQNLLANLTGIEVIGCNPRGQADLLQAIRLVEPDVVLLTRGEIDFADFSGLFTSQKYDPKLRIIAISPFDNLMHVYDYDGRQRLISSLDDLIEAIFDG